MTTDLPTDSLLTYIFTFTLTYLKKIFGTMIHIFPLQLSIYLWICWTWMQSDREHETSARITATLRRGEQRTTLKTISCRSWEYRSDLRCVSLLTIKGLSLHNTVTQKKAVHSYSVVPFLSRVLVKKTWHISPPMAILSEPRRCVTSKLKLFP